MVTSKKTGYILFWKFVFIFQNGVPIRICIEKCLYKNCKLKKNPVKSKNYFILFYLFYFFTAYQPQGVI